MDQLPDDEAASVHHGFRETMAFLSRVKEDRGLLIHVSDEERIAFFALCGQISKPSRAAQKQIEMRFKKAATAERKVADRKVLQATGLRQSQARGGTVPFYAKPPSHLLTDGIEGPSAVPAISDAADANAATATVTDLITTTEPVTVQKARSCYVCGCKFTVLHHFYASMCVSCADLNWAKRLQTYDLTGRHAVVTGGRVKIGFHIALKLLRAGAFVVVISRFPRDAALRYSQQEDYAAYADRVKFIGVDLRHTPSVEKLCDTLIQMLPKLDYLIHNSCQTVRRPPAFYNHLLDYERAAPSGTSNQIVIQSDEPLQSFDMTQIKLLKGDEERFERAGELDVDGQQKDPRAVNSWKLLLADVSTVEIAEVMLVNAIAPFVMNARLKRLMCTATRDAHIVNVSAMEGIFYRTFKTASHPHTNMAKAALNMMTRTSAQDYVRDGIYMVAVDTGWVTDENPAIISDRLKSEGFDPPLDIIDGAARVVDPIFDGLLTGKRTFGVFLKNYAVSPW